MSQKLKIYACSGIGNAQQKTRTYDYWTDNTNSLNNTQAVNNILAKLNLAMAKVEYQINLSNKDVITLLNNIDFYVVCLEAAQNYAQHYSTLERAGRVIGWMANRGDFNYNKVDNASRDAHLDELLAEFAAIMASGEDKETTKDFAAWWNENIVVLNQVWLNAEERSAVQTALQSAVAGIGDLDWRSNADLAKYLSDGGTYFLYTYFTDAQLKQVPAKNRNKFAIKKQNQQKIYEYCKSLFVGTFGTEKAMQDIIRSGIVAKFGAEPETVCADVAAGKRDIEGVGLATEVIVAIIGAVVTILGAIISAIVDAVKKNNADKYAALDDKIINAGCPNPEDFSGLSMDGSTPGTTTAGGTSMSGLLIVGVAAAIYLLNKK